MAENIQTEQANAPVEKLPLRKRISNKLPHLPRSGRVAAIAVAAGAGLVAYGAVKNAQERKNLDEAADRLDDTLDILEQHVTSTD